MNRIMFLLKACILLLGVCCCLRGVTGSSNRIKCWVCDRAQNLDSCTTTAICQNDTESCYTDELITEQLAVVYNGGCRANIVCNGISSSVGRKRRGDLVACSRCCDNELCNNNLCGIKNSNPGFSQCYSCDSVSTPEQCLTLQACQPDEVCVAREEFVGGHRKLSYGCERKLLCKVLMQEVFADLARCESDPHACGGLHALGRRSINACHSCCADAVCNSGYCMDINKKLYNLYKLKEFDLNTLMVNATTGG